MAWRNTIKAFAAIATLLLVHHSWQASADRTLQQQASASALAVAEALGKGDASAAANAIASASGPQTSAVASALAAAVAEGGSSAQAAAQAIAQAQKTNPQQTGAVLAGKPINMARYFDLRSIRAPGTVIARGAHLPDLDHPDHHHQQYTSKPSNTHA